MPFNEQRLQTLINLRQEAVNLAAEYEHGSIDEDSARSIYMYANALIINEEKRGGINAT